MEGRAVRGPGQEGEPASSGRWRDLGLLAVLLTAAVALRAWLLCHTEVAARDSIGFIRYALELEDALRSPQPRKSWADILNTNHQHPGYPLTVLAASVPVRALVHAPMPDLMRLSAQLASSLAAVLLVIPMYFLGKLLFHRPAGFWAALMFQCLPVSGHILSDGLSEALFLLLTATGLLLGGQALHTGSRIRFALCGLSCGLAYLTRPEGALMLAAVGLSMLVLQWVPLWRRTWRATCANGLALSLTALVAGSPYFLATGCFTRKPSVKQVMGEAKEAGPVASPQMRDAGLHPAAGGGPVLAAVPAVMLSTEGRLVTRLIAGLWGLGAEVVNGFHYVVWIPALLGMWWNRRQPWVVPSMWPLLALSLLYALVLWQLGVVVGYLSDRHIQVLVLCGIYPAAAAVLDLPGRLRGWLQGRGWLAEGGTLGRLLGGGGPALAVVVLVVLTGAGLPKTLHTLHGKRAGHHAAGLWLARHAHPADLIMDRHAWSHYYAGCVFREGLQPPPDPHPVCYHVITKSKDSTEPEPRGNDQFLTEAQVRALGARLVYHWPERRPPEKATVLVYVVPGRG
jgi:4-amino-4-deoxy-L-arabinose transferase-like glycosyltransferase